MSVKPVYKRAFFFFPTDLMITPNSRGLLIDKEDPYWPCFLFTLSVLLALLYLPDRNWHRESIPGRMENRKKDEFATSPSADQPQQCVVAGKIWDSRHISGLVERRRRDDGHVSKVPSTSASTHLSFPVPEMPRVPWEQRQLGAWGGVMLKVQGVGGYGHPHQEGSKEKG